MDMLAANKMKIAAIGGLTAGAAAGLMTSKRRGAEDELRGGSEEEELSNEEIELILGMQFGNDMDDDEYMPYVSHMDVEGAINVNNVLASTYESIEDHVAETVEMFSDVTAVNGIEVNSEAEMFAELAACINDDNFTMTFAPDLDNVDDYVCTEDQPDAGGDFDEDDEIDYVYDIGITLDEEHAEESRTVYFEWIDGELVVVDVELDEGDSFLGGARSRSRSASKKRKSRKSRKSRKGKTKADGAKKRAKSKAAKRSVAVKVSRAVAAAISKSRKSRKSASAKAAKARRARRARKRRTYPKRAVVVRRRTAARRQRKK